MIKKIGLTLFLIIHFTITFATSTGKLTGKIYDDNQNPIANANIVLEDKEIGAISDENGKYILKHVESGKYNVICSKIGFKTHKIKGVVISIDETMIQNFSLEKTSLEMSGITVSEARYKLVDNLKTSSGNIITEQQIEEVNIDEIFELIALQAATSVNNGELHIRGGRMNEVVYIVDGISVSDIVDGEAALAVDVDAIQEIKVMTGGFPAEYGNAQSGIINIITKRGKANYSGKLEFYNDMITDVSNNDVLKFSLGGPIIPTKKLRERFTFFVNGKVDRSDTRLNEFYGANPYDEINFAGETVLPSYWENYNYYSPYSERKEFWGVDLDERNSNKYNFNAKLYFAISPLEKLTFSIRRNDSKFFPFDQYWRYAMEHYKEINSTQDQAIVNYSKSINNRFNLEFKLGYYHKDYRENPRDLLESDLFNKDPENFDINNTNEVNNCTGIIYNGDSGFIGNDVYYWMYSHNGNSGYLQNWFTAPGSYYPQFIENQNKVYTIKTDVDFLYNQVHSLRSGIEVIIHKIDRYKLVNPWVLDEARYNYYLNTVEAADSVYNEVSSSWYYLYELDDIYDATIYSSGETYGFKADPMQFAYYFQDKMEWEGLVVNAGIRLDSWYLGAYYQRLNNQNRYEKVEFEKKQRLHFMVSPRIGVSHSISQKSVLHFAFNYQNQLPLFENIYAIASPSDVYTGNEEWEAVVLGNPDIDPQITITGEIGLQHQFSEKYFGDITIYYKKNFNYPSIGKTFLNEQYMVYWYQIVSENYGTAKGIDLNLQRVLSNFFNASFSYSLSWAEGTATDLYDFEPTAENPLREFPLEWDSRHNLGFNMTLKVADKEELYLPFSNFKIPLDDFRINLTYNFASGTPFTDVSSDEVNGERKPHTEVANLSISKSFNLLKSTKLNLFVKINNLFNYENINFAYLSTGSPYYDGTQYENLPEQYLHDMNTNDPQNVDAKREIIMGVSLNW
ncbi:MAG: TonB-dependent receptor [Candidatus Cloacimonetes bacterium]|nr:TonB-dependent receptor [Candidatus Cloacimonadota bacterium]